MKISVINGKELTEPQLRLWSRLQQSDPAFASPYFCHQFISAVASVRSDVFVGVMKEGGRTVGFFPFQRGWMGVGQPVGGGISDYQGVLVEKGVNWSAEELISGCSLSLWDFNHLIACQEPFKKYHLVKTASPVIDLSGLAAFITINFVPTG